MEKIMMQQFEHDYHELIRPDNFINLFKDIQDFEEWCHLGTIKDLDATLAEFEKYELYEYCQVIKGVIQSLKNSRKVFISEI
jgi:hypothetical protein